MSDVKYIITDIETDGLDPQTNSILEIAFIAVDDDLREVGRVSRLLPPHGGVVASVERMSPFVREMHTKNGLIEDLRRVYGDIGDEPYFAEWRTGAQLAVLAWMRSSGVKAGSVIYVGHSVAFDRSFYKAQLPLLDWVASHHLLDLTAVRTVMNMAGFDLKKPEQSNTHRAVDDCLGALEELRSLKDLMERSRLAYVTLNTQVPAPQHLPAALFE